MNASLPCPNRPTEALGNPAHVVDKPLTVTIVEENILASIPSRSHMVTGAFKLDSKLAGLGPTLAWGGGPHARYLT
jgi:hypothetical protein